MKITLLPTLVRFLRHPSRGRRRCSSFFSVSSSNRDQNTSALIISVRRTSSISIGLEMFANKHSNISITDGTERVSDSWSTSNVYLNEIKVPLEILRAMRKNNRRRSTTVETVPSMKQFFYRLMYSFMSFDSDTDRLRIGCGDQLSQMKRVWPICSAGSRALITEIVISNSFDLCCLSLAEEIRSACIADVSSLLRRESLDDVCID